MLHPKIIKKILIKDLRKFESVEKNWLKVIKSGSYITRDDLKNVKLDGETSSTSNFTNY